MHPPVRRQVFFVKDKFQSREIQFYNFSVKIHKLRLIFKTIKKLSCFNTIQYGISVFIVYVRKSKSVRRKHFKEFLFGFEITFQIFVIIQMLVRQISKNSTSKFYTGYSILI